MRSRPAVLRVVSFGGLALAGLVGGHALGYAIAVPDAHHRSALIASTGHGYLPSLSWTAIVCGLAAIVAGLAAGYLHHGADGRPRALHAAARIVPMQAGAFVLIEVVERLASGAALGTLSPSLLVVGVVVQLFVGLLVAFLLAGLRRAGAILRTQAHIREPGPTVRLTPRSTVRPLRSRTSASVRVRAPPLPVCA